jgi:hypothetical protein
MEYKPPFDPNSKKQYRFLYCALDSNELWKCVRCETKEICEKALPSFESQMSRLIQVDQEIPKFFDTWRLRRCLRTSNIQIQEDKK